MINRIITLVFLTQSFCLTANTVTTALSLKNNIKADSNKTNIEKGKWVKITGKANPKIQSTENEPNKNYENITILLKYKKDSLIWISARKGLEICSASVNKRLYSCFKQTKQNILFKINRRLNSQLFLKNKS